jgi:hypothetical protein
MPRSCRWVSLDYALPCAWLLARQDRRHPASFDTGHAPRSLHRWCETAVSGGGLDDAADLTADRRRIEPGAQPVETMTGPGGRPVERFEQGLGQPLGRLSVRDPGAGQSTHRLQDGGLLVIG